MKERINKTNIYLDTLKSVQVEIIKDEEGNFKPVVVPVEGKKCTVDYLKNLNKMIKLEEDNSLVLTSGGKDSEGKVIKIQLGQIAFENGEYISKDHEDFGKYFVAKDRYEQDRLLTISETRVLSDGDYKDISKINVPLPRKQLDELKENQQTSDFHSHMLAVPTGSEMFELMKINSYSLSELKDFAVYDEELYLQIKDAYFKYRELDKELAEKEDFEKASVKFEKILPYLDEEKIKDKIENLATLSLARDNSFEDLSRTNKVRQAIAGLKTENKFNGQRFFNYLMCVGKSYEKNGIKNAEISYTGVNADVLKFLDRVFDEKGKPLDIVKQETGVDVKLFAALDRNTMKNGDVTKALEALAYDSVCGIDICGEELESVKDIEKYIITIAAYMMVNCPNKTFRLHAGESGYNEENVKLSLGAIVKAQQLLKERTGQDFELMPIRIGHAVYGVDKESIELFKQTNAKVELNVTSNMALANAESSEKLPVKTLLKNGIGFVVGSDGAGTYNGDALSDGMAIALRLTKKEFKAFCQVTKQTEKEILEARNREINPQIQQDRIKNFAMAIAEAIEVEGKEEGETFKFSFDEVNKEDYSPKKGSDIQQQNGKGQTQVNNSNKGYDKRVNFTEVNKKFEGKTPIAILGLTKAEFEARKSELVAFYKPIIEAAKDKGNYYIQLDLANIGAIYLLNEICSNFMSDKEMKDFVRVDGIKAPFHNGDYEDFPKEMIDRYTFAVTGVTKGNTTKKLIERANKAGGAIIFAGGGVNASRQVGLACDNKDIKSLKFDAGSQTLCEKYGNMATKNNKEIVFITEPSDAIPELADEIKKKQQNLVSEATIEQAAKDSANLQAENEKEDKAKQEERAKNSAKQDEKDWYSKTSTLTNESKYKEDEGREQ